MSTKDIYGLSYKGKRGGLKLSPTHKKGENMKCVFCEEELTGYGNNSEPLTDKPCCNFCNSRIVVPVRTAIMNERQPKVRLHSMYNEPQMEKNLEGTIDYVDGIGQIHVKWDNGSTLALNAKVDIFSVF